MTYPFESLTCLDNVYGLIDMINIKVRRELIRFDYSGGCHHFPINQCLIRCIPAEILDLVTTCLL